MSSIEWRYQPKDSDHHRRTKSDGIKGTVFLALAGAVGYETKQHLENWREMENISEFQELREVERTLSNLENASLDGIVDTSEIESLANDLSQARDSLEMSLMNNPEYIENINNFYFHDDPALGGLEMLMGGGISFTAGVIGAFFTGGAVFYASKSRSAAREQALEKFVSFANQNGYEGERRDDFASKIDTIHRDSFVERMRWYIGKESKVGGMKIGAEEYLKREDSS